MGLDIETLMEIEDYIKELDEQIGLKSETMIDVEKAISKAKVRAKRKVIIQEEYPPKVIYERDRRKGQIC